MLIQADSRHIPLGDETVQCVVTSPPYWGLRDYGVDGQLGLEKTPEEYVANLVAVFREVRRVLRKDGTVFLNLGDSYSLKPKDLVGIPWRVAFALQADGWWLRQDIIWSKPNPMPESVTDRCTKAHEYVFLLTKSSSYFWDAEAVKERAIHAGRTVVYDGTQKNCSAGDGVNDRATLIDRTITVSASRNRRSVWHIPTQPYKEAHFATFPEKLVEPCILAGSRPSDVVLDPFCGSGTVGVVAARHNRRFIGLELNAKYIELAKKRLTGIQPYLAEATC